MAVDIKQARHNELQCCRWIALAVSQKHLLFDVGYTDGCSEPWNILLPGLKDSTVSYLTLKTQTVE